MRSFEIGGVGSERAIFLYHFISAIAVTGAFGLWAFAVGGSEAWTLFVCAVMLHGIYSLSFLELWALADDSYSLAIMEVIDRVRYRRWTRADAEARSHRDGQADLASRCPAGNRV